MHIPMPPMGRRGDPDLEPLHTDMPAAPTDPSWRGFARAGGGWAARMADVDEFFGTSSQVSGGFWPFGTAQSLPVEGVPVGRLLSTGAAVCCDPISWFRAGIIEQPSMFVLGMPGVGKSTMVRRLVWGLAALGVNTVIPGDLKPDYARLTRLLAGQVIPLGPSLGSINPMDPGGVHAALPRLTGDLHAELLNDYTTRRRDCLEVLLSIARAGRTESGGVITDVEGNILSTALNVLQEHTRGDPEPPLVSDLRDLIHDGTPETRAEAVFDDPNDEEKYREATHGLVASLNGLSNPRGRFGRMFCAQTSSTMDLSRPVDFDISSLADAGGDVVAAVLAVTWSHAFAAKNAADMLAEAGLAPRRNHVIVMDELHRALRSSPLMVDKLDLLTRLNRQWGVGQIMITHTFADLMCLDSEAQNTKARGFVERSKIKLLGALGRNEVERYLRAESGLQVSMREEDLLSDWTTPLGYQSQAKIKGVGKFLVKTGGLPGLPVSLQLCDLERQGFNDTNAKWHEE